MPAAPSWCTHELTAHADCGYKRTQLFPAMQPTGQHTHPINSNPRVCGCSEQPPLSSANPNLCQLSTVGIGDIHAHNAAEMLFSIFAILLGLSVFGYTAATVSYMLGDLTGGGWVGCMGRIGPCKMSGCCNTQYYFLDDTGTLPRKLLPHKGCVRPPPRISYCILQMIPM